VTSQGRVNGRDCWIVEFYITPAYMDVSYGIEYYDKSSQLELKSLINGIEDVYSYQPSDASYFPLEVGKQVTVTETDTETRMTGGHSETNTTTDTYTYSVEAVEEITVPAGTFKCFKVTDGSSSVWHSDKVKNSVKEIDEDGTRWVLGYYSV
jgi:hypothetical protein